MDINNLSNKELQCLKNQILEREQSIKETQLQEKREKAKLQIERLRENKDFLLNEIIPNHDRSSCNDDNICNGLNTAEYGHRCIRCALLELLDEDWRDGDYEILFNVTICKIQ